jgi:4-hydroxybenzoate polyprenyltransferase
MRLRHWPKSLLVFIPFILTLEDLNDFGKSAIAFLSFGLASSAVYAFNDAVDKNSDILHPQKKHRPVASGVVSTRNAVIFSIFLAVASLIMAIVVNLLTLVVISLYLGSNLAYSIYLKRLPVIDLIVLSIFYILRIAAGGAAIMVELSGWLLVFGFTTFLSLAFAKRFIELQTFRSELGDKLNPQLSMRGYILQDANWLFVGGFSLGIVSALVLALYLDLGHSIDSSVTYIIVPLWTYWILRIWLLASRGRLHYDPTTFALRDSATWLISALIFVLWNLDGLIAQLYATYGGML